MWDPSDIEPSSRETIALILLIIFIILGIAIWLNWFPTSSNSIEECKYIAPYIEICQ